ncbi:MAG: hypothetical protein AABX51_07230 [Nanoarchaeota archaeon]
MDELPNAISYVIYIAILASFASVAIAWGPMRGITSFSVADTESGTCTDEKCNVFDVKFCQDRDLKQADYDCVENRCRLVSDKVITKCNFDCVEPDDDDAHCQLALNT